MTDLETGFDFDGLTCYRSDTDSNTFYYVPGPPTPETNPMGRPTLLLLVTHQGGTLQLGVRWQADSDLLEALREELANRNQDLTPALIRLAPAPVTVGGVKLLLGNGEGHFDELQTARSSGMPPYSAIFNVSLTADQQAKVTAALNGRQEFLCVYYDVSLLTQVSVSVTLAGDVQSDVAALGRTSEREDLNARIELALSEGRLTQTRAGIAKAPDELWNKAERLVRDKAVGLLQRMVRGQPVEFDESSFEVTATVTEQVSLPLDRATDVGDWFSDGSGANHIHILASPTTPVDESKPDAATTTAIKLGFDPEKAPIAFIQVSRGAVKETLRPPSFDSVTLPATAAGASVALKTSYSTGGAPYETTRSPAGDELVLELSDLGLAQVIVDGTARREGGSKKARVRVLYQPDAGGSRDDRTIYFRRGEWQASWYLITRSPGLGGTLEFEWKETLADGSIVKHRMENVETPEITLQPG